jgi:hypothetical protein
MVKVNVLPPPGDASAQIRPPWLSTIRRQVARAMPLPSCSPPLRIAEHEVDDGEAIVA